MRKCRDRGNVYSQVVVIPVDSDVANRFFYSALRRLHNKEIAGQIHGFSSIMKKFVIFFIFIPLVNSGVHSFKTAYTAIIGQTTAGIPEFSAVTTLDGEQIDYYDSEIKKLIPKQDWMKEFTSTEIWKEDTEIREEVQQIYINNIHGIMQRFNQSDGVHTYQRMYGCEWDDETGDWIQGFDQYGYDGEDFISLDLKEDRYFTPVAQAIPTVMKWNNNKTQLGYLKQYYDHECVDWLKEFLTLSKEANRITAPEVFLLQKNPSSPVECHTTGFYPSGVSITWLRNGVNHYKDVEHGELLPNEDETFQRTSTIRVSPVEWEKYQFTCEVKHEGKTIQKILTEDEFKSNKRPPELYVAILVSVMGGVIILVVIVLVIVFYIMTKKLKSGYRLVSSESEEHIFIDKGL